LIRPGGMALGAKWIPALAAGWLVLFCGAVPGLCQTDHQPPVTRPGGIPSGMLQPEPASAVIDTALATLEFSASGPALVTIHTVQDTVLFGDVFHLILEISGPRDGQAERIPEIRLTSGDEWLVPVSPEKPGLWDRALGREAGPLPDMSSLPAVGEHTRLVRSFRVYRTNPFRVEIGSLVSPVIQVKARVPGTDEMAGIRAPRPGEWSPLMALGLLLFLFLVLWLAWMLWERARRGEDLADRDLPPPAWLAAAIELRDLLHGGSLSRGDSRIFLDGLAGITRRYVAGRYRIAAQEMTGREILAACSDLGHRSTQPGVFARMIDSVDLRRYNPEVSGAGWCRDQAVILYDQMAAVRILPRYSGVSADLLSQGDKAWSDLKRELASGPGRLRNSTAVSLGGKT
jgi:hypothetical protein